VFVGSSKNASTRAAATMATSKAVDFQTIY
jgi:hypothetical protein